MGATLCSRCKQRPAVIFITRMEGDKAIPEGLCLKCARELNIAPINQMLDKMNLSDEDLESMTEEVMSLMGGDNEDDEEGDGFTPGGAATFPFLKTDLRRQFQPFEFPAGGVLSQGKAGRAPYKGEKEGEGCAQTQISWAVLHRFNRQGAGRGVG